jgi:hypothetical protein
MSARCHSAEPVAARDGVREAMRLSYILSDYPHDVVEIECDKCGRHGRLRTAKLIAEHGPDTKLPDLLRTIAQCPKWGSMDDGCRAQYAASSRMD